jgi:anti-anti-sigma regulatory factor
MKPVAQIVVCAEGSRVCIRIQGRADVSVSVGFKELLNGLLDRRIDHYELELSECQTMDSTFLGVLCGFARRCTETLTHKEARPILFNANKRISELLESLGVDQMFVFERGEPVDPGPCVPLETKDEQAGRDELNTTALEAHKTLMALNPDNIPKFKDLTEFLAEDLKKLRSKE